MVVTRKLPRYPQEHGAAAVEFALIIPVLVLLVFGIVQFSIAYDRQQSLHSAAREGARIASLPATTQTDISNKVTSSLSGVTFDSSPAISVNPTATRPCENWTGKAVTVTVTANSNIDIPLFGSSTVTLTGRGEFRCE